jgi:hypothetical protein
MTSQWFSASLSMSIACIPLSIPGGLQRDVRRLRSPRCRTLLKCKVPAQTFSG